MVRVLVIAKDLQLHGITGVIMNYFRALDVDSIKMDFAVGAPVDGDLLNEIEAKGSKLVLLPSKSKQPIGYYASINRVMKEGKYDILHVHGNSATITVELFLGLKNKIQCRIAHSHNSTCNHTWIHKILKPAFKYTYTKGLACSDIAGKWMFGNGSFQVIQNGFDTQEYIFSDADRKDVRNKYGLEKSFVVGHIGYFNKQKNHARLIDIFYKLKSQIPSAKLLLIGDGYTRDIIVEKVNNLNLENDVVFAGTTKNIPQMLAAMDCFLFPSLYEGLGIVLLEAQISGLPCVLSDVVPDTTKLGDNYFKVSLEDSDDVWVKSIVEHPLELSDRRLFYNKHREAIEKYEITKNVSDLFDLYNESR